LVDAEYFLITASHDKEKDVSKFLTIITKIEGICSCFWFSPSSTKLAFWKQYFTSCL